MSSTITALTSGGGLAMAGDTSGQLELKTNNGTTAVTIDTSQNVGIGTSSSVNGLSVYKYGTQWTGNTTNLYPVPAGNVFIQTAAISGANNWIGMTGSYGTSTGSANLLLQTNLNNTGQQAGNYIGSEATSASSADLTFGRMIAGASVGVNATKSEAMRISSAGQVIVGTTAGVSGRFQVSADGAFITPYAAPTAGYFFSSNSSDGNCVEIFQGRFNRAGLVLSANNTGTQTQILFYEGGSAVGSVTTTTSSTAYNTSSDYRLKENIAPMTGALATVQSLKPVTYKWKLDGSIGQGFIAHELQEVVPDAVTGEKDAVETVNDVDADGKVIGTKEVPKYQGIDTSFLVATLTAAIQELNAKVDAQAAEIQALKGVA